MEIEAADQKQHYLREKFFSTPVGMRIPMNASPENSDFALRFYRAALSKTAVKELNFYNGALGCPIEFLKDPAYYIRDWKMYCNDEPKRQAAMRRIEDVMEKVSLFEEEKKDDMELDSTSF